MVMARLPTVSNLLRSGRTTCSYCSVMRSSNGFAPAFSTIGSSGIVSSPAAKTGRPDRSNTVIAAIVGSEARIGPARVEKPTYWRTGRPARRKDSIAFCAILPWASSFSSWNCW